MIRFENVTKTYKGNAAALADISVEIQKGEFVFLVGSSGSGKTTFLKLLLREDVPDSGVIWVAGRDIGALSHWRVPYLRRNLGCVFQDFRLLPNKSVAENVAFALEVIGRSRSHVKVQVEQVLDLVGLGQKAHRMPDELSGGEQQRVAVARAFVNRPLVLLADEPTGNLDPATSQGIMALLDRINRTGTTVVMATHDVGIVDMMRRRVIELDQGHLIRDQARGVYGYASDLSAPRGVPTVSVLAGPPEEDGDDALTSRVGSARAARQSLGSTLAISVEYVAKETLQNLWRNRMMTLAAVLTVAVSLSLVGAALLFRQGANNQLGQLNNNVSLQIFMNPEATTAQTAAVNLQIQQTPQISSCRYLDHQQSYEQAKQVLKGEPSALDVLTPATTPPVFDCKSHSAGDLASLKAIFESLPGVYNATYPAASVRVVQRLSSLSQIILLALAIILLISSLVLILNAIRMAIFARRREIGVMKLVGATNWFIRVPFMLEGLVQGVLGGVAAVIFVIFANMGLNYVVNHYHVSFLSASVLSSHDVLMTGLLLVVIGIAVGVVGSGAAIRRFLDV